MSQTGPLLSQMEAYGEAWRRQIGGVAAPSVRFRENHAIAGDSVVGCSVCLGQGSGECKGTCSGSMGVG